MMRTTWPMGASGDGGMAWYPIPPRDYCLGTSLHLLEVCPPLRPTRQRRRRGRGCRGYGARRRRCRVRRAVYRGRSSSSSCPSALQPAPDLSVSIIADAPLAREAPLARDLPEQHPSWSGRRPDCREAGGNAAEIFPSPGRVDFPAGGGLSGFSGRHVPLAIFIGVLWIMSHAAWNQLMHALHGNGDSDDDMALTPGGRVRERPASTSPPPPVQRPRRDHQPPH